MSVRELQQALAQIGQQKSLPELEGYLRKVSTVMPPREQNLSTQGLIEQFDRNRDGLLDFAEFVELMLGAGDKLGVRN